MWIKNKIWLPFLLINTLLIPRLSGQGSVPDTYLEKAFVHTDRDYYITGEDICFKIYLSAGDSKIKSQLVYLTLKNTDQEKVQEAAMFISGNSASGIIPVMDTLTSGTYYLEAGTNWMRNYSTQLFNSKAITIVNKSNINDQTVITDTTAIEIHNSHYTLNLITDKETYSRRSAVNIQLEAQTDDIVADLSLSASFIPASELNQYKKSTVDSPRTLATQKLNFREVFPLESEGQIISGRVLDEQANPVSGATVMMSFQNPGANPDYDVTDSHGRFFVTVPLTETNNTLLFQVWQGPVASENCDIVFDIRQDEPAPIIKKLATTTNIGLVTRFETAIKVQEIATLFSDKPNSNPFPKAGNQSFHSLYAGLEEHIVPADYIKLNSFSEIIYEIVPGVQLKNTDERLSLRVVNAPYGLYFSREPLVIINGIPVKNYNFLTALNSDDISYIDVVKQAFVFGNLVFDGLVAVQLKTSVDPKLLTGNQFFTREYSVNETNQHFRFPEYTTNNAFRSRKPDFRNTLYWNPDIRLSEGKTNIRFYTSDLEGTFQIQLSGLINGTTPVSCTKFITVHGHE